MPKPKARRKVSEAQARQTQLEQKQAEEKRITFGHYRRRRALGWALVGLAVAVLMTHWLRHLGVGSYPSGLEDLAIGYPTAGLLGMLGAVVLSR
ncbi:hypothetical protein BH18ACT15_BH18ACT15_02660 [soil metagenome]